MAPNQHFIHVFVFTFEQGFYAAVFRVAYPTGQADKLGLFADIVAKAHTLDVSFDDGVQTEH